MKLMPHQQSPLVSVKEIHPGHEIHSAVPLETAIAILRDSAESAGIDGLATRPYHHHPPPPMTPTHPVPMSHRLYALDENLDQLEQILIESGGEITPDIEAAFSDLFDLRSEKIEGYLRIIRRCETGALAYDAELQRLQTAKRTLTRTADSLKARLRDSMIRRGETEHQTGIGRVKLQRSGSRPVVLLAPVEDLPEHFRRVKVDADLSALGHALKEGDPEATKYAELGEASQYLRFY